MEEFLPLVRTYATAASLTIEVTSEDLQIGSTKITRGLWKISLFQNPCTAPATLRPPATAADDTDHSQGEFHFCP